MAEVVEPKVEPVVEPKVEQKPDTQETQPDKSGFTHKMRELSKEWGINLFDESGLEQLQARLTQHDLDLKKTAVERDTFKTKAETLEGQVQRKDFDIEALSYGVSREQLNDVYALSNANKGEGSLSDGLKATIEKYKGTFGGKGQVGGIVIGEIKKEQEPIKSNEYEAYKAKSTAVKLWEQQQQKYKK